MGRARRLIGAGELRQGHRPQVHGVDRDVKRGAEAGSQRERTAQLASGLAHLASDVRGRVPAAVGEEHGDERGGDASRRGVRARRQHRRRERCRARRRRARHERAQREQPAERRELSGRQDVLRPLARPQPERVQRRQRSDGEQADDGGGPAAEAEHLRDGGAEAIGERGDRAGKDDEKARPAAEEPEHRTVRLAQVHVLAARARKHPPELAVAEGARQRDGTAEDPRGHKLDR
jgi:hypothetical protein